ncbi:hypothetical protein DSO57_1023106 [Entomophthora muscae]|uniref:Uncharacterized protein n=1 Tax=Entomophthora muscae TaxID=34485 RepID=A0ACC2U1D7_9FUNG|nr:hypothetical protein DSO57_1023106 [Entomophthora muscae]
MSEVISYSSGSAAILAIFFLLKPTRVWVEHLSVDAMPTFEFISQIFPFEIKVLPKSSEFQSSNLNAQEQAKELIWVELMSLSTGKLSDYCEMIKGGMFSGYKVAVDASYCPPPFCFPLKHGFDVAVYSKPAVVLGPHGPTSGYVAIESPKEAEKLLLDRTDMGPVLGNLNAWNSVRCLKTYALRSQSQSDTARKILEWLKGQTLAAIKDIHACDVTMMEPYLPPVISIQVSFKSRVRHPIINCF